MCCGPLIAQNHVPGEKLLDVSLFWKRSGEYVDRVESGKGDLYKQLGHHGPAIENAWAAYRIYFNDLGSVDILSKFQPRLELKTTKWYAGKAGKAQGYGTDNYLVGKTAGLGGLRLWDGQSLQNLGPVALRTGEVFLTDSTARMRITAFEIPYKGESIDVELVVTTFSGARHAMVEARVLNDVQVQFATGITAHEALKIAVSDNCIITWGDHDSPAAGAEYNVGAALLYNVDDVQEKLAADQEHIRISRPTTYWKYYITTANDREKSALNNYAAFEAYVRELHAMLW